MTRKRITCNSHVSTGYVSDLSRFRISEHPKNIPTQSQRINTQIPPSAAPSSNHCLCNNWCNAGDVKAHAALTPDLPSSSSMKCLWALEKSYKQRSMAFCQTGWYGNLVQMQCCGLLTEAWDFDRSKGTAIVALSTWSTMMRSTPELSNLCNTWDLKDLYQANDPECRLMFNK